MSIKPESQFIKGVHKYLTPGLYSMKNHNQYVAGVPDCWYSGNHNDLWVEYKFRKIQKPIATVVPDLSPQQLRWIRQRQDEGRNVWVIMGVISGGVIFESMHHMENGMPASEFLRKLMSRKDLAERINMQCMKREGTNTLFTNVGATL